MITPKVASSNHRPGGTQIAWSTKQSLQSISDKKQVIGIVFQTAPARLRSVIQANDLWCKWVSLHAFIFNWSVIILRNTSYTWFPLHICLDLVYRNWIHYQYDQCRNNFFDQHNWEDYNSNNFELGHPPRHKIFSIYTIFAIPGSSGRQNSPTRTTQLKTRLDAAVALRVYSISAGRTLH